MNHTQQRFLNPSMLVLSETCTNIKNFIFTFEAPQRSAKKNSVNFLSLIQYEVKTCIEILPAFTLSCIVSF